jgi:hypothetical protein
LDVTGFETFVECMMFFYHGFGMDEMTVSRAVRNFQIYPKAEVLKTAAAPNTSSTISSTSRSLVR